MRKLSLLRVAGGAALLALAFAPAAMGQPAAQITLSRDVALWNDRIEARIEGTGCTGAADPTINAPAGTIDIALVGCDPVSAAPFTAVVPLGPLPVREYLVRVHASGVGSPVAAAQLSIHRESDLEIVLPATVLEGTPFTVTFTGPASSPCVSIDEPVVEGHVIEATFIDACPILPPLGPALFEAEIEIGPLPAGEYEVRLFEVAQFGALELTYRKLVIHDPDRCVPSDTTLCLQDGRFRVEVEWEDFQGHEGAGHAVPLAGGEAGGDGASGLFWFFAPENIELTVKVLNACTAAGGHWWVFISSGSSVEYTVTVTDTLTGTTRRYSNDSGEQAPLRADTSAFPCTTAAP